MSKVHRAFFLQLFGAVVAIGVAVWLVRTYPVLRYITQAQGTVAGLGWFGMALYPVLYAACNVLLLPAGTLALGSGMFFGLWGGFAVNVAGNVLSAFVSMALSRRFGRGWIRRALLRRSKWAALDEAVGREGWKMIFLSQLIPFAPSSLLNYLFGVTRVRLRTALFWSALGQVPTMFVYAYLGTFAKFGIGLVRGTVQARVPEYFTWAGGLLLTVIATVGLARISTRLLAEAEAHGKTPAPLPEKPPEPAAEIPPAVLEQAF
jgi:uncharacterized membrane protein YdjX (TVP38/TMEM64 family)